MKMSAAKLVMSTGGIDWAVEIEIRDCSDDILFEVTCGDHFVDQLIKSLKMLSKATTESKIEMSLQDEKVGDELGMPIVSSATKLCNAERQIVIANQKKVEFENQLLELRSIVGFEIQIGNLASEVQKLKNTSRAFREIMNIIFPKNREMSISDFPDAILSLIKNKDDELEASKERERKLELKIQRRQKPKKRTAS